MRQIPLMTLPVYRLSREQFNKKRDQYVEKSIFGGPGSEFNRKFYKNDPEILSERKNTLCFLYGAWKYNEIIGYIHLHILGSQVRGEYWQVDKKRICKSKSKRFRYVTHKLAYEISFHHNDSNEKIYNAICSYVELCRKELKIRYVDDSNLINIGKLVDWSSLLKSV